MPEACARREFEEELGVRPEGALVPLGRIRQKGGKWVEAFALEGDLDAEAIVSNSFTLEWPPKSGRFQSWPEIDRARWFALAEARGEDPAEPARRSSTCSRRCSHPSLYGVFTGLA